jgi:hypothetical protein
MAEGPEVPAPRPAPEQKRQNPAEAAVLLAQAEQRLAQERLVMQAKLDRDRELRRIQVAMGWLIVVMLPSVALVCVGVMISYDKVPRSVLNSAAGAFFVDIIGLVVAGWRTLLIRNLPDEPLTPVTAAPELHHSIDVGAAEVKVVRLEDSP